MGEEKDVECKVPLEEWVEGRTFQTTDDIQIPEIKADQEGHERNGLECDAGIEGQQQAEA